MDTSSFITRLTANTVWGAAQLADFVKHKAAEVLVAEAFEKLEAARAVLTTQAPSEAAPDETTTSVSITTSICSDVLSVNSTPGTNSEGEPIQLIELISRGDDYSFTLIGEQEIADFGDAMKVLFS